MASKPEGSRPAVATRPAPRRNGQTADERRSDRRARLVAAAIRLYGRQGFRNTGVRAICQEAGLTERYFYESFASGEALLAVAFGQVVAEVLDAILRAAAGVDDPVVRVERMLAAFFDLLRANPASARVFLVEIVGVSPAIDTAFARALHGMTELLLEAFDPGRAGPLATQPLLRRAVSGGLLHIALAWGHDGYARPLAEVTRAAAALCRLALPDRAAGAVDHR